MTIQSEYKQSSIFCPLIIGIRPEGMFEQEFFKKKIQKRPRETFELAAAKTGVAPSMNSKPGIHKK